VRASRAEFAWIEHMPGTPYTYHALLGGRGPETTTRPSHLGDEV
jgi:hypothetical protein